VEGVLVAPRAFRADQVLAKHDETYMPREVAEALKKKGLWRGGESLGAAKAEQAEGAAR
jgi:cytochrome c-type biogenesis protein CcmE